jgi:pyruvate dehydrogenase E1 component alpha subunit
MQAQRVLQLYRTMHLIRSFDEAAGRAFQDGRIRGPVQRYVGQEAIAAGVCASLRPTDYIVDDHGGHGHAIAKGADIGKLMKELFGREGGLCGGRGGPRHIADFSVGMLGGNGVVADGATIAVGAAQAVKLLRQDRIVVSFFEGGAVNRGPLLEALNWAMVYRLPLLLVCEDNQYSTAVRTSELTAGEGIVARARSFGMPSESIDGSDVIAVLDASEKLAIKMRKGEGPALIQARLHPLADDPLQRCRQWLQKHGIASEPVAALEFDINAAVEKALQDAEAAPLPSPQAAFDEIQDLGAEAWPR